MKVTEAKRLANIRNATTHGKSKTRIYSVWEHMLRRCRDHKDKRWGHYGGRGIKVCDRWLVFENFYVDMGDPPNGMTLDRIDNNGNYAPSNCRWATSKQQQRNKTNNHVLEYQGEKKTLTEWAEDKRCLVGVRTLSTRINAYRWSAESAITSPRHVRKPDHEKEIANNLKVE